MRRIQELQRLQYAGGSSWLLENKDNFKNIF